jgi:LysM repeat protein
MGKKKKITFGLLFSGLIFTACADIFNNNLYQKKYSYTFDLKEDADEEIIGLKRIKTVNGITENEYTVQEGDNIYKITKKTGQNLTVLLINNPSMEINSIASPGNVLKVFGDNIIIYKKNKDETFSDIEKKFALNNGEIKKLNSGEMSGETVYVKAEENRLRLYLQEREEKQKLKILYK